MFLVFESTGKLSSRIDQPLLLSQVAAAAREQRRHKQAGRGAKAERVK
jgi:hypothetical protein